MWREFLSPWVKALPRQPQVLESMCGLAEGLMVLQKIMGVPVDYVGFDYSDTMLELLRGLRGQGESATPPNDDV